MAGSRCWVPVEPASRINTYPAPPFTDDIGPGSLKIRHACVDSGLNWHMPRASVLMGRP